MRFGFGRRRQPTRRVGITGIVLASLVTFRTPDAATLSCAQAAAVAEAEASVPPGLLLAIGTVESGRVDATGRRSPWPWTINAGGIGRFFDTAEDAGRAVQSLRTGGVLSIDIGCFQINLLHHPDAFTDVVSGFDPLTNALGAARFLVSLHTEFADWGLAIAAYHSRTDTLGVPYRDRVLAAWHGAMSGPRVIAMAAARAVTIAGVPASGVQVSGVQVWGPEGALGFGASATGWTRVSMLAVASRQRLPRIVTPTLR
jgi:hypothetical protein